MAGAWLAALIAAVLAGCAPKPPAPPEERLLLQPARFADLPGWYADPVTEALPSLLASCQRLPAQGPERPLDGFAWAGTVAEWQAVCRAAREVPAGDEAAARRFFESELVPVAASNNGKAEGLFTGYYEASLRGSRRRSPAYAVPLHARPADLVTVDLGQFRDSLKGQRIAGRVVGGALRPYEDRAAIEQGRLGERAQVLLWVDDAVDAFFLQVQGSGRVELDDGSVARVGYAAQNGHPYVAIGRTLIERGALPREDVSMQSIRAWLAANPAQAAEIMRSNPSYVFFREIPGEGPIGAQGVPLAPGRALAVDRKFLPLGVPVWLDAAHPTADGTAERSLRRLLIAQDTGGAIRGPVRGDVFWGHGAEAAAIAGRMKHPGRYWLLLPRAVAERLKATS